MKTEWDEKVIMECEVKYEGQRREEAVNKKRRSKRQKTWLNNSYWENAEMICFAHKI